MLAVSALMCATALRLAALARSTASRSRGSSLSMVASSLEARVGGLVDVAGVVHHLLGGEELFGNRALELLEGQSALVYRNRRVEVVKL